MNKSIIETLLGAAILALAVYFLAFGYQKADIGSADGYKISADFTAIGGLQEGDDVQISGVKIGYVDGVELMKDSYLARVHMHIEHGIELPLDTAALISSDGLLGGRYLALEPGAEEEVLIAGDVIEFTQAPQNLEQLLGQFIFSMQDDDGDDAVEDAL